MVLSGHVEEILLRLEEMADRSGKKRQNFRLPSPLGIACQMQSELQNAERKDEEEIARIESGAFKDSLQASNAAHSGDQGAAETARLDEDRLSRKADELTQRCDEREEKDLAAMAAKLREISARFFFERAAIREEMLRWRAECIKQHFYPGEGEAAISSVYGSEADLSTENFENLKFPFDEVTNFLGESTFSPGSSHLYLNSEFRLPSMTPHPACASRLKDKNQNYGVPGKWTTDVKSAYPDLCDEANGGLRVSEYAPQIQEGTASGAALFERP
jgi:hypothetical protein